MESKKKKDQFVVAYLANPYDASSCVEFALQFARLLDKGLILLYVCDQKQSAISVEEAEKRLVELNKTLPDNLFHSYAVLKGESRKVLNAIGEVLNAVLLVASCNPKAESKKAADAPRSLLSNLSQSRIAYLICRTQSKPREYKSVVLTLNQLRESKEKTLWASYLGRFAHSEVVLYYRRYKDAYFQKQLNLNIAFARKMFEGFAIAVRTFHSPDTKTALDVQALNYCESSSCDLLICQTTKDKGFIDRLLGLEEEKVLMRIKDAPVLFLNPREDLFILCE